MCCKASADLALEMGTIEDKKKSNFQFDMIWAYFGYYVDFFFSSVFVTYKKTYSAKEFKVQPTRVDFLKRK